MISILAGDNFLEIGEISLSVNLKSPLFFGEMIFEGSYIFDFNIPSTPENRKILGFSNVVGIQNLTKSFPGIIYYNNVQLFSGEIKVVRSSDEFFDLRFFMFNGYINSKIIGKKLPELNLGSKEVILPSITRIFSGVHVNEVYPAPPVPAEIYYLNPQFLRYHHNGNYGYFHESGNAYTVYLPRYFRFYGAIHLEILYGSCYFQVLKNNILYLEIYFDNPVKKFSFEEYLLQGDTLTFRIKCISEAFPLWHRAEFFLRGNSHICCEDYLGGKKSLLDPGHQEFCFFPVRNDIAYELITNEKLKTEYHEILPVINFYQPISGNFQKFRPFFASTNSIIGNVFVPFIFYRFIFDCICREFGFQVSFETQLEAEINTLVMGNHRALNITDLHTRPPVVPGQDWPVTQYFLIDRNFNISDHVPDMNISDFIKLITLFGLVILPVRGSQFVVKSFNEIISDPGYLDLDEVLPDLQVEHEKYDGFNFVFKPSNDSFTDQVKEIDPEKVKGTVQSLENLPQDYNEILDLYFVNELKQYWIWEYDNETDSLKWQFYSLPYSFEKVQAGEKNIEVEFDVFPILPKDHPRFDIVETDTPLSSFWQIPKSLFPLHFSDKYETRESEHPNWIAFYRGMRPTSDGKFYPMGSSKYLDVNGNSIPGCSIDLFWNNQEGLYEKFWKKWVEFLLGSNQVTIRKVINTQEIVNLDFSRKYMYNSRLYFIREVSFTISHAGFSTAEFVLMTIN